MALYPLRARLSSSTLCLWATMMRRRVVKLINEWYSRDGDERRRGRARVDLNWYVLRRSHAAIFVPSLALDSQLGMRFAEGIPTELTGHRFAKIECPSGVTLLPLKCKVSGAWKFVGRNALKISRQQQSGHSHFWNFRKRRIISILALLRDEAEQSNGILMIRNLSTFTASMRAYFR